MLSGIARVTKSVLAACAAAATAATAACVTHMPMSEPYDGPRELPAEMAERFAVDDGAPREAETDRLRERRDFVVREVTLPTSEDGEEPVVFEYYDVDGDDETPVVVLLPIVNGNLLVSRYFARYFARRGWAAVVVDHAGEPLDGALDDPEGAIRRSVLDYRQVIDWAAEHPQFDTIGVFGISFGGMAAVVLAAVDERVDAIVAAMAGGDIPYLMMNTSYRSVARRVHRHLRESGLSRERLEEWLDEKVVSDPLDFAPYVDAEEVMLVTTRSDLIVPHEAQEALRKRLGGPETLSLPTGHRTSVVYFPLMRSSAFDFFERQFSAAR